MPGGDGTGPAGMGSMTGRGAGYCAGHSTPGFANPAFGRAYGGFGFGRGFGRGFGYGFRGCRRGRWAVPYGGYGGPYAAPYPAVPTRQQEMEALQDEAKYLADDLEGIKRRIAELESEKTK
ncbi:MAG: DUF5320 domain-containing protein [Desulfobacterales bacterium]|nr:DUF5320 domain-containing protein [Desulfobacterales bacterium]